MSAEINRKPKGTPAGGEFAKHDRPEADAPLGAGSVPVGDPFYGPEWPTKHNELFESAGTFEEVDALRTYHRSNKTAGGDDIGLQWAAENRCRRLRAAGAELVQSELPERNGFRSAQNLTELDALWEQFTEEPPGDGEASASWLRRWLSELSQERDARLTELQAAGVVSPNIRYRR